MHVKDVNKNITLNSSRGYGCEISVIRPIFAFLILFIIIMVLGTMMKLEPVACI